MKNLSNRAVYVCRFVLLLATIALTACGSGGDDVGTAEAANEDPTAVAEVEESEADEAESTPTPDDAEVAANDLLANSVVIDTAGLPFTDTVNTSAATSDEDDDDVDCPGPPTNASVWYSITPESDTRITVSAEGSDYAVGISAASGEPGSLQLIECRPFDFVVEAQADVTYYFQVFDSEDSASQGGNLVFSAKEAPALDRQSTEGLAPLGQEFIDAVASDTEVTDGTFTFAVVDSEGEAIAGSNGTDAAGNAPTATDVFRIGSITKVFTSAVVLTLVDDGVVDLDAAANTYVTRVPVPDDVTVRDLLRHTSGIFNYTDVASFFPAVLDAPDRLWTPEEVVAVIADEPSVFEAGAEFGYSNTNYAILGVLIEEVTQRPYHDIVRERIISPLDLSSTYLAGYESGQEVFDPYEHEGAAGFDYTSLASSAWSAGAMVSSAGDLHTLFTALFDDQIVPSELVEQMTNGDEYGLGIELGEANQGLFGHSGGINGYETFVRHSVDSGTTAFLASTDPNADTRYAREKLFEGFATLATE